VKTNFKGIGSLVLLGAVVKAPWAMASAPSTSAPPDTNDITVRLAADGSLDVMLDPAMWDPVHIAELLDLLHLPAGATPEQIRDQLKLFIGKACTRCLSATKHLSLLGLVVAMAANGISWDVGGDGFLHWRDLAAVAGHPAPDNLSSAKAAKYVQDQLASAGAGLVTFQDLGQLIGMVPVSTKDEIVSRFKELSQAAKQPVQSLSAATPVERRLRLIILGVQAINSPMPANNLIGLARATAAHEAENRSPEVKTLSAGEPETAGLTGLRRAVAANKQEHALVKSGAKAKPKTVPLTAGQSGLTGLDRAIAAHALNPGS